MTNNARDTPEYIAAKARLADKLALAKERRKRMIMPFPPPRYDDIFREGLAMLDAIARGDANG